MQSKIKSVIQASIDVKAKILDDATMHHRIEEAALQVVKSFQNGCRIYFAGNGGSAADAQHIAAELTGRYKTERRGLPAIALTTDTSALTAIANDFGYDKVFSRQVEALANQGD